MASTTTATGSWSSGPRGFSTVAPMLQRNTPSALGVVPLDVEGSVRKLVGVSFARLASAVGLVVTFSSLLRMGWMRRGGSRLGPVLPPPGLGVPSGDAVLAGAHQELRGLGVGAGPDARAGRVRGGVVGPGTVARHVGCPRAIGIDIEMRTAGWDPGCCWFPSHAGCSGIKVGRRGGTSPTA